MRGPAWVGIGAQRSGTTWFTGLLCQHPKVELGTNGRKEQRALHEIAEGRVDPGWYVELFEGGLAGEFSPMYLRHLAAVRVAATLTRPEAPFIVLLRDPIDRFVSAMRQYRSRDHWRKRRWPYTAVFTGAQWAGMYADQLDVWAAEVGRDRLVVLQYEAVRQDPEPAVAMLWRRLGEDPVPLYGVDMPSKSASTANYRLSDSLRTTLALLYQPQVDRLVRDWNVDPELWPNFCSRPRPGDNAVSVAERRVKDRLSID